MSSATTTDLTAPAAPAAPRPYISAASYEAWKNLGAAAAPLTIPLARKVLLTGASGTGKSSVCQGIAYAMGAGVADLGRADRPGDLLDLIRGTQRAAVELSFSGVPGVPRLTLRRELGRTAAGTGQQKFRCSPGPLASNRNEDHEAAAAEHVGDFVLAFNPVALLLLPSEPQRQEVLRLTGGLQRTGVTVETVAAKIWDLLPELTDDDLVELGLAMWVPVPEADRLPGPDGAMPPTHELAPSDAFAACEDPLAALTLIVAAAEVAERAQEKLAKVARAAAKATPAEYPDREQGAGLRAGLAQAERAADQLREQKGALQERRRALAEQAAAAAEQLRQARAAALREREQAQAARAALEQEIQALERQLATAQPAAAASAPTTANGSAAAAPAKGSAPTPALTAVQQLEQALASFDWTFNMADDRESYRRGEDQLRAITGLLQRVEPRTAYAMWQAQASRYRSGCPSYPLPVPEDLTAKLTALRTELEQLTAVVPELEQAEHETSASAAAAHLALADQREAVAAGRARVQLLTQQSTAATEPTCSRCGMASTAKHRAGLAKDLEATKATQAEVEAELQRRATQYDDASAALAKARLDLEATRTRQRDLQRSIAATEQAQAAEQTAAAQRAQAEQAARHAAELAAQRAQAEAERTAQARERAAQEAEVQRAGLIATLQAKREQLASLPVLVDLPPSPDAAAVYPAGSLDAELAEVVQQLEAAEGVELQARQAIDAWNAAEAQATESRREIERAREQAKRLTSRRDLFRRLVEVAQAIEARLLGEAFDPFVLAMRELLDGSPLGTFVADPSGGGLRLGFLRDEPGTGESYFVRLRPKVMSGGELAMAVLALARTILQLRRPLFRVLLLDDVPDADPGIQAGIVAGGAALVDAGELDQFIACSHYIPPDLDCEACGITVIDMSQATAALAPTAAQAQA